jgi:hypothetical protein
METKLLINIAHNKDSDDVNKVGLGNVEENVLSTDLCNTILSEFKYFNNSPTSNLKLTDDTVSIINPKINSRNIAINIHFNCFAIESAKGTEAIIPFKSTVIERTLAKILVDNISACLATKNRGVRTEITSFKQEPLFLIPNYENILLKICFITNKADILMYVNKQPVLSKIIARCIYDYVTN